MKFAIAKKLGVILVIATCIGFGASPLNATLIQSEAREDNRAKQLDSERKKLEKAKNPVARTDSLIKIAEITVTYVADAAMASDFQAMERYLDQYRGAVLDARNAMMGSGLDPYKKPDGYKMVELAIRRHLRTLEDTAKALTLRQRQPVEDTMVMASAIRDEFLHALFR